MMATTKIWPVCGWLGAVVVYVEDPEKTERAKSYVRPGMDARPAQGLEDVIDYAMATNKTVEDEGAKTMRYFVSGINCTPGSARGEMLAAKARYEKKGGIVAFHGYQSFAPGEVSPEIAHEIGVRLAEQLWGGRFQVVVATHLDKGHIHNHFVCNSVSHIDGRRFRSNKKTYRQMRKASDTLCREYALSVIDGSKPGKARHYSEWQAARDGKPTWRQVIQGDVDECIARATTGREFFSNLTALGYEYKQGKDISVRPPGKERFLRLARNLGDGYTFEAIRARIQAHCKSHKVLPVPRCRPPTFAAPRKLEKARPGSITALYHHYLYLMGYYQRHGNPKTNARMHFLLREDIARLDDYIADTRLLGRKRIETAEQLCAFQEGCEREIDELLNKRKELKAQIRADAGAGNPYTTKDNPRYLEINRQLKKLRKEVVQCGRISGRAQSLSKRIERIEQDEDKKLSNQRKEEPINGRNRTGNRPDHAPDTFGR